ncbi:MAG: DegT/DnrJ/EryC1/StrS family aminotransferase [Chloroflexi bacterium]|nr:DegT/DnrJ/EryC1/StrS family aminotransferase [Chloroflexota bacterium]MCI0576597.1 DegT/DnrJ/EryC1/StrS family aminotransferase [Chloroflexota bacterium]MCI0647035.1 DegT/DnrJ/EryC1/StrS family aminotransferase [Chloroflexota bacterium]MCI0730735.1 DegT/DnrJ/EryC1/StrS family aminotransferase [Chloroflexota bacterium]
MSTYLYQMEPAFDDDDVEEVAECVRSSWVIEAQRTAAFEQAVAEYVGAACAVAVPSCTIALAASLMALGIGPGDEVIVPDLTFVATANAVSLVGAKPVLVDIDPQTLGLDPIALEQSLTRRTRVVMPVWFNGRAPDMAAIMALARAHGLAVVEDAACALGSRCCGQHAGTFGDLGCFSFNTTKIITTGTGGMVVTDDPELRERVERLKNHGRLDRQDYHPVIGYNFHFSDLLAALGLAQMRKLPARVVWKRELYSWYARRLEAVPGVTMLPLPEGACPWYPDVFVDEPAGLRAWLEERGIQTRLYFPPVHTQPCYQAEGDFADTAAVSRRGIWLPAAAYLTQADVVRVCQAIIEWQEQRR